MFTLLIELGHWEETSDVSSSFSSREASKAQSSLERPPNGVPQSRYEAVRNKFRKVSCRPGMTLQFSDVGDFLRRTAS